MNIGRSIVKLFVSKGANTVLFFAGTTLFARWLSAGQIGVFFLYVAVLGLLSIPANLGIRGALEKRLSEGQNPGQLYTAALTFKAATVAIVLCGLWLARAPLAAFFETDVAFLLMAGVVVRELALFYESVIRGELRVGETAALQITRRIVWIVVGGWLVLRGHGAPGLILGLIAGYAAEVAYGLARSRTSPGGFSSRHLRSMLLFSKYDVVLSIGGRVYQWMDVLIIGLFLAQYFVGAYEIAWRVTLLVLLVSKPIERTLFPQISEWSAQSAEERIETAVSTALGFTLLISIPAIVGAVLYGEEVLRYLFGEQYAVATAVLVVLMVEKVFQSFNDVIGTALRAIDRPDLAARATVASVGLNLVLSPVLVVTVGFLGAAVATTLSWFVNTLVKTQYLFAHVDVDVPYRLFAWYALASGLMGVGLVALQVLVPVASVWDLLGHVAVGAVLYFGLVASIPDVRDQVIRPSIEIIRS